MLVGNKCDDSDKREVQKATGTALQVKRIKMDEFHFYWHVFETNLPTYKY